MLLRQALGRRAHASQQYHLFFHVVRMTMALCSHGLRVLRRPNQGPMCNPQFDYQTRSVPTELSKRREGWKGTCDRRSAPTENKNVSAFLCRKGRKDR